MPGTNIKMEATHEPFDKHLLDLFWRFLVALPSSHPLAILSMPSNSTAGHCAKATAPRDVDVLDLANHLVLVSARRHDLQNITASAQPSLDR